MNRFKKHIISRFFWLMMAFNIFNFSIDVPDTAPNHIPEDLSINDLESIVEIILEKIFSIENAVAELDDLDDDSKSLLIKKGIDFFVYTNLSQESKKNKYFILRKHFYNNQRYFEQFKPELVPPPPKA